MSATAVNQIKSFEIGRLTDLGIPYDYVHVTDDRAVVKINERTMSRIISERSKGVDVGGLFVSENDKGEWTASWVDPSGEPHTLTAKTINLAYKAVLGYQCGRRPRDGRWRGYCPLYHLKSTEDEEI